MGVASSPLAILLMVWGAVTAVLIVLVIYGNTLYIHEDEEIYINEKEEAWMGGGQKILIAKMERLKKLILSLAVVSAILLLASGTIWVYIGRSSGSFDAPTLMGEASCVSESFCRAYIDPGIPEPTV